MIYYVAKEREFHTLSVQLICLFPELQGYLRLVPYERLHLLDGIREGVLIWSDLDRMTVSEGRAATAMSERLTMSRVPVTQLNSPATSLGRFDLLRRLSAKGWNTYDVHRLHESPRRYPVFLRAECGFAASAPALLADAQALGAALVDLTASGSAPSIDMIVEFGSRPSADGYYRKYGAYRIGDIIFPQHCIISEDWFIKASTRFPSAAHRREHLLYFHENPHRDRLRSIFDLASIQYGRIDYTVVDGMIQVFEINTNPTIIGDPPRRRRPDQRPYAQAHACALLALPGATEAESDTPDARKIADSSSAILQVLKKRLQEKNRPAYIVKARRSVRALLGA